MELYLIRHTRVNVPRGVCYGQTDVETAASYQDEHSRVRQLLPDDLSDFTVFSSPLDRCSRLATDLFNGTHNEDERIMEMNFGDWEMKKWSEIERDLMDEWARDFVNYRCPGGESYKDLYIRSASFFDELRTGTYKNSAVVTHAGVLHAFLAWLLDIDLKKSLMVHFDYGSITQVHFGRSRTVINYMNRI